MNLLVTGGAGFLGSHFVRSSLAGDSAGRVTVLDRLTYASSFANLAPEAFDDRLNFVPGEVADAPLVDNLMRGQDAVLHLVGADVLGTQILLDAAQRHGVARFVQLSPAAVYGSLAAGAWSEGTRLAPSSPDAARSAASDLLALAAHRTHGLSVVIVRACSLYGPGQHPSRTVPRAATSVLSGRPARLRGSGAAVREWLHVDDLTRALARLLPAGRPGEVYHVGGSIELSERELAGLIVAELRVPGARIEESPATALVRAAAPVPDEPWTADERRALDDKKLRRELGWQPAVEFETGLAGTLEWYRANPGWWRPLLTF
jgi:dTDP-glucose 4,6-dehydratase